MAASFDGHDRAVFGELATRVAAEGVTSRRYYGWLIAFSSENLPRT
jgi:hypothetical protein